ncbi:MAG: hypothetical protein KME43_21440 [Myxacorys chilensis ATA2-1-KO14]|jgi:hypothetical protein|nr:hypothetical protein [Myxacorys chilensis ATA2-1-KO14]
MIQELLQKWAALEPSRCCRDGNDYRLLDDGRYHYIPPHPTFSDYLALLQHAVQAAISSRGSRMQLENSLDGWKVVLLHPDVVGAPILSLGKEAAIALLTAYVNWLEKNQEVRS